jgi:hypothetical protein
LKNDGPKLLPRLKTGQTFWATLGQLDKLLILRISTLSFLSLFSYCPEKEKKGR